jgi:hypothetical protein
MADLQTTWIAGIGIPFGLIKVAIHRGDRAADCFWNEAKLFGDGAQTLPRAITHGGGEDKVRFAAIDPNDADRPWHFFHGVALETKAAILARFLRWVTPNEPCGRQQECE